MAEQKKRRLGDLAGQLICILLLLALLAAMLLTEAARAADSVSYGRITSATYTVTDTLEGYLFRDERVLTSKNPGVISYTAPSHASVTENTVLAHVYNDDTGTNERATAAALYARIEECRAALAEREESWQSEYLASYAALMQQMGATTLHGITDGTSALAGALARKDASGDETAAALAAEIESLEAQIAELIRHEDAPEAVAAPRDGVFCRDADGRELAFDVGLVSELTPTVLDELISLPVTDKEAIGRVVITDEWYLAIPLDAAACSAYRVGDAYTVYLTEKNVSASMTVARTVTESEQALLILRGTELPPSLLSERRCSVRVEREHVTGLRIPAAALYDGNTVFVEEDGVARARTVTPMWQKNGCVLLSPEECALREGERVLISVRRIYDGKAVD